MATVMHGLAVDEGTPRARKAKREAQRDAHRHELAGVRQQKTEKALPPKADLQTIHAHGVVGVLIFGVVSVAGVWLVSWGLAAIPGSLGLPARLLLALAVQLALAFGVYRLADLKDELAPISRSQRVVVTLCLIALAVGLVGLAKLRGLLVGASTATLPQSMDPRALLQTALAAQGQAQSWGMATFAALALALDGIAALAASFAWSRLAYAAPLLALYRAEQEAEDKIKEDDVEIAILDASIPAGRRQESAAEVDREPAHSS